MEFADKNELEKGISNLAIAAATIPLIARLKKEPARKQKFKDNWVLEFILLSLAAFIGSIVHSFKLPEKINGIVWGILYAIEFELVRRLHQILSDMDDGYKPSDTEFLIILIAEISLYIPATLIRLFTGKNTFSFFIAYSAIVAVLLGKLVAKQQANNSTKSFVESIVCLLMAVFSQVAIKDKGATIAHMFIVTSLLPLSNAAKYSFN